MSKHHGNKGKSPMLPLRPQLYAALRGIGIPEDRRRELADRVVLDEWVIEAILVELLRRIAGLEKRFDHAQVNS